MRQHVNHRGGRFERAPLGLPSWRGHASPAGRPELTVVAAHCLRWLAAGERGLGRQQAARRISMAGRAELLEAVGTRHRSAARLERSPILDRLAAVTGHHRKRAIRLLSGRGGGEEGQPETDPPAAPAPVASRSGSMGARRADPGLEGCGPGLPEAAAADGCCVAADAGAAWPCGWAGDADQAADGERGQHGLRQVVHSPDRPRRPAPIDPPASVSASNCTTACATPRRPWPSPALASSPANGRLPSGPRRFGLEPRNSTLAGRSGTTSACTAAVSKSPPRTRTLPSGNDAPVLATYATAPRCSPAPRSSWTWVRDGITNSACKSDRPSELFGRAAIMRSKKGKP